MIRRVERIYDYVNENLNIYYLMTKSYRINNNYSLFFASQDAKNNNKNLIIKIIRLPEENSRNNEFFNFMTKDLSEKLKSFSSNVELVIDQVANIKNASTIYMDKPFLRKDIEYFKQIKSYCLENKVALYLIDSNVCVPIRVASAKEEYSAKTLRGKITKVLHEFKETVLTDYKATFAEEQALKQLDDFIENKLDYYDIHNDPSKDFTSNLSAYLKYGFISPVTILNILESNNSSNKDSFIEELVVRRELAYNFVYFNKNYDQFDSMTYLWAYRTMEYHLKDKREYLYSIDDYINFKTHDPYFNAAMKEMVYLGKMHSYMRMYWCKKIIEWSKTYEEAYEIAIYLNNYYFLDGNTPNGYAGVAWCFGKHDRAWKEREIFGKLRYMNANGLKRKFDIDNYIIKIEKNIKEK